MVGDLVVGKSVKWAHFFAFAAEAGFSSWTQLSSDAPRTET